MLIQRTAARTTSRRRALPRLLDGLAFVLVVIIAVAPAHAGSWKGQEVQKEGALHVMNPAKGTEEPMTIDLKEQWRLGGFSDNDDEFFGVITRITTDPDGNIYVLDTQLSEIKIYDPTGAYLNTIGREGEGPGEFRRPADMFFMPDGTLGVMQVVPGKIVKLTTDGEPAGDYPLPAPEGGGFQILQGGRLAANHLVLSRQLQTIDREANKVTQSVSLDRLDLEGKVVGTYTSFERELDLANLVIDEKRFLTWERSGRWDVGSDGRVFVVTGGGKYAISVFNADCSLDRVIEREYEQRKRNAEETAKVQSLFESFTRGAPNAKVEVNDYDSDVKSVHPRDDGTLWVLTSRGARDLPKGVLGTFDVVDDKGHFVRSVTLKGQGNPQEDGYFFVGDRLYVVTGWLDALVALQGGGESSDEEAEATPMELICYRVESPVIAKGK